MARYLETTFQLLMRRVIIDSDLSQSEEAVFASMLDACHHELSEIEITELEQRLIFLKQATDHMGDATDG
jgi:hypothetical protein